MLGSNTHCSTMHIMPVMKQMFVPLINNEVIAATSSKGCSSKVFVCNATPNKTDNGAIKVATYNTGRGALTKYLGKAAYGIAPGCLMVKEGKDPVSILDRTLEKNLATADTPLKKVNTILEALHQEPFLGDRYNDYAIFYGGNKSYKIMKMFSDNAVLLLEERKEDSQKLFDDFVFVKDRLHLPYTESASKFYDGWFDDYVDSGKSLRTSHERDSWVREGLKIKQFIDVTKQYNLIWRRITDVSVSRNQPCYDACMPKTHTIITNGVVSHNSDVRCKFTPRSSGQPLWPKNFDKETAWEVEPSVEFDGGRDSYRYVQVKTVKNKLSTPNRIGWIRIWASDGAGEGRGYDPVFDTAYYLYVTGQLTGRGRKSMKLLINGEDVQPAVTWGQIKTWILGNNAQKKEICQALGFEKAFDLRTRCFHQMRTGLGEKLYVEHSQAAVVETEE